MIKYKNEFILKFERDKNGRIYNELDNYLACRAKGKVYRYNSDTLTFVSPKKIRIEDRYMNLILDIYDTDEERIITFKEENLYKLADLFKLRRKRHLTDEQKKKVGTRLLNARSKCLKNASI